MVRNIKSSLQNIEHTIDYIVDVNSIFHAIVATVVIILLQYIIGKTPAILLAEGILIITLVMVVYNKIYEGYDKIKG